MTHICVILDIDSKGNEILEDRPTGADREWMQPSKTINHDGPKRVRKEKQLRIATEQLSKDIVAYNSIKAIVSRADEAERKLVVKIKQRTGNPSSRLKDVAVQDCLNKSLCVDDLKAIIHRGKFTGPKFQLKKLVGIEGKCNKTVFNGQTAEEIEAQCSESNPCLVWWAWTICRDEAPPVLILPDEPALRVSVPNQTFDVVYAGLKSSLDRKRPSEYLKDEAWVSTFRSSVKGFTGVMIDGAMLEQADKLLDIFEARMRNHVANKVDTSKYDHFTLSFIRDNLPPMSAAVCIAGHAVDDLDAYDLSECILKMPADGMLSIMTADLKSLEGCYLFYDRVKRELIRSGKASGDGPKATFDGRGKKHIDNSKKMEEMMRHRVYQIFPSKEVKNIGARGGYFENLDTYCGMAYDKSDDLDPLCSRGERNSLLA